MRFVIFVGKRELMISWGTICVLYVPNLRCRMKWMMEIWRPTEHEHKEKKICILPMGKNYANMRFAPTATLSQAGDIREIVPWHRHNSMRSLPKKTANWPMTDWQTMPGLL